MKRIYSYIALLLTVATVSGQTNTDKIPRPQLPEVVPPSPTVAALMKYEEVNVDNYTGIPDISIPFFSTSLGGPSLDVRLSYHPANANANAAASDCGLGWSLMAGGTISRTVRGGCPDELMATGTTIYNSDKVGVYRSLNPFYDISAQLAGATQAFLDGDYYNNLLWETVVRSKFDSEHDLYQYNFLGYSGRFIIKKVGNALVVEKLDVNPLKITNNYNTSDYTPNSFVITDQYGYNYTFDILETSTASSFSSTVSSVPDKIGSISGTTSYTYRSAFHLSQVTDSNNVVMATFVYENTGKTEIFTTKSQTIASGEFNKASYDNVFKNNADYQPVPLVQSNSSQNNTVTRKLNQILIPGKNKITFNFTLGRSDTNLQGAGNSYKLSDVTISDYNNVQIKHFKLNYTYSTIEDTRMMLSQVRQYDQADATYLTQNLEYYTYDYDLTLKAIDYWGYFTGKPFFVNTGIRKYREPSSLLCKADILRKITLPTGGCKLFDFESNTYSFKGSEPLENFDGNPDNWTNEVNTVTFNQNENNTTKAFLQLGKEQDVYLAANNSFGTSGVDSWFFSVKQQPSGTIVGGLNSVSYCQNGDCYQKLHLLPGTYTVQFSETNGPVPGQNPNYTARISVYYRNRLLDGDGVHGQPEKKFLYGGGIRIRSVSYYDSTDVDETTVPQKRVNYGYSLFSNSYKSSGSLVYETPGFLFTKVKRECVRDPASLGQTLFDFSLGYTLETTTNLLSAVKTKGADVGYGQITVSETGNGRSEYEYTSAVDVPETYSEYNTSFPYLPTLNVDFRRGLLKKMRAYSQAGLKLKEVSSDYTIDAYTSESGLRLSPISDYAFRNFSNYTTFANFKDYLTHCRQYNPSLSCPNGGLHDYDINCTCFCYEPVPNSWAQSYFMREAFGWARLSHTSQDEYFYNGSTLSGTVHSDTDYSYNFSNQQVKQETTTASTGESVVRKYYFSDEGALDSEPNIVTIRSRHAMATPIMIESYRNSSLTSRQKTLYKDFGAGQVLPEQLQFAKENKALETRIRYTKYDAKGNPLEVQQENGAKICYIWGYDASVPVAKIENMEYANILPATLISDIVTASSSTGTEAQLITKLDALRTAPALADALVTTFTYKPQVGPSVITDPKGDKLYYTYDAFGRLIKVVDRNGKILSENEYHYKN